jgi:hypothetical protein
MQGLGSHELSPISIGTPSDTTCDVTLRLKHLNYF